MSIRIIYKDCFTGDIFVIESRACPVFGKILLLSVKWVSLDDPPLITVIPTQVFKIPVAISNFDNKRLLGGEEKNRSSILSYQKPQKNRVSLT